MSNKPDPLADIEAYWKQPNDEKVRVLERLLFDYASMFVGKLSEVDNLREQNAKLQATIERVRKLIDGNVEVSYNYDIRRALEEKP